MTDITEDEATESPDRAMQALLDLFDLEPLEVNLFRARNPNTWPGGRVFGGLVASQALRAAMATVDVQHYIHSFHSYFMRPGQPGKPMVFSVDRVRDGRSFTTRVVTAIQDGEATFTMTASFHKDGEEGIDYQLPRAQDVPDPDDVDESAMSGMMRRRSSSFFTPFELREMGPTPVSEDGTYRSTRRVWMRTAVKLPDDRDLHACALTFMSDMAVVTAARPPMNANPWEGFMGASLDHAVWFHRPTRADDWMLYDLHCLSAHNARGMARGTFHTHDGTLLASVAQEALIRPLPAGVVPPHLREMPPEL